MPPDRRAVAGVRRPRRFPGHHRVLSLAGGAWLAWMLAGSPGTAAGAEETQATRVKVTGLGWVENLQMKAVLRQLPPRRDGPAVYDVNAVEDAAFLLLNHVQDLGFLDARITCELTDDEARVVTGSWRIGEEPPLPRPRLARKVRFVVDPGLRYYYDHLEFRGLTAIPEATAREYFVRSHGLFQTRALRRFSPRELDQAVGALRSVLGTEGRARAEVSVAELTKDPATGAVRVVVAVEEGPRFRTRNLVVVVRDTAEGAVATRETRTLDRFYSEPVREDLEHELLLPWFHDGYPDATCRVEEAAVTPGVGDERVVDLSAEIVRGPRVRLGTTRLTGPAAEQARALARKTRLEGPWLDRLAVDEARARLSRWGAFRFVNVRYDLSPEDPEARDPVFELEPGRQLTVDVLAGFRSYDLLYGGLDVTRRNLFGLGHVAGLRFVQSFRSSEGLVSYSVPDVWVDGLTVFALADALAREEVSFRREELRLSAGARQTFETAGQQAGLRYNYEFLRAVDAPVASGFPRALAGEKQPDVASVTVDWIYDRRDSAVTPRKGVRLGATLEVALPEFGGEARFLRPEIEATWHWPLGGGRFVSVGARQTVVAEPGNDGLIPFNKRVFPGGEDSVRGYQRGEAASLNDEGEVIGSESALVWNLEFEQPLTASWSVVAFVDGVGLSASVGDTWWQETLWSVGGGIRRNTVVGPIRLEYGFNPTRREGDPTGTLHFSVGFPF